MSKWKKSSAQLIAAFTAALPKDPKVEPRRMFGYPCAFVNGNMFTGLHEENLVVRLPEAEQARLLKVDGARPFEVLGRRMREYVAVPPAMHRQPTTLRRWIAASLEYAAALPAKDKAKKRAAKGGAKPARKSASKSRPRVA